MTREQLIDRIKKLLALSSSPNSNEAEVAMKRAQELMEKYGVKLNEEDKTIEKVELEVMEMAEGIPLLYQGFIASTIAHMFSCEVIHASQTSQTTLVGFPTNIEVTKHALDCVLNQAKIEYKAYFRTRRSIAVRESFWTGFFFAFKKRYEKMERNQKGLVLYDHVAAKLRDLGVVEKRYNLSNKDEAAILGGQKAAERVQIRKGVSADSKTRKMLD